MYTTRVVVLTNVEAQRAKFSVLTCFDLSVKCQVLSSVINDEYVEFRIVKCFTNT